MIRSFVALDIPSQVKRELGGIIGKLQRLGGNVKWVRPENLHVTLKFLGEVEPEGLEEIYRVVEKSIRGIKAFPFSLSGAGIFPNPRRPRVFWIGIKEGGELAKLSRLLDEGLETLGFPREKRGFSPHLTIGRARTPQGLERLTEEVVRMGYSSEGLEATSLFVMKSKLTPQGPIYSPLREFKLKI